MNRTASLQARPALERAPRVVIREAHSAILFSCVVLSCGLLHGQASPAGSSPVPFTPPSGSAPPPFTTPAASAPAGVSSPAAPAASSSDAAAPFTGSPELNRRAVDLEGSQPSAHEEYTIGGGDEIALAVTGRPELSSTQTVGPDGRITLPMVGSVDIGDKTREQAADAVDDALGKFYSGKVFSTIQVTKYGSNHILLLGSVEHAGVISFDQPPTLLEAIARGGSVVSDEKTSGGSSGGGTPKKCIVYRGDNSVMNVNISERLDGQRALNDILLKRNDIVYIPENQGSLVSVLGEVGHPGPVGLRPSMTLVALLAESGGITQPAGNPMIQIVHPSTGQSQQIRFKELLKPQGGSDISLHDGDIVYVPRRGLANMGYVLQQIAPLASLGTIATFATK